MTRLRISELALQKGFSNPNQLALAARVSAPTMYDYWNNDVGQVKIETLARIAQALNVGVGDLLTDTDDPEKTK